MLSLTAKEIMELLPHRYPFLYLDSVQELVPCKYGIGIKNVTINEPFFQGHFPNTPILPGIIIIEALAQLTAIVYATVGLEETKDNFEILKKRIIQKIGYLTKVNIKFTNVVVPGEQLLLSSKIGKRLGNIIQVKVEAIVKEKAKDVAIGEIFVSEKNEVNKN